MYLANLVVEKSKGILRHLPPSQERGTAIELCNKICDATHTSHAWSIRKVDSIKSHSKKKKKKRKMGVVIKMVMYVISNFSPPDKRIK